MKNYRSFIMSCAVLASVGPASAANVIWNTVQAVTAATDVNTTGTLEYAVGFGSTSTTVSGVTFGNTPSYGDTFIAATTGFMGGITFIGSNNSEGQAYATLLDSGRYNNSPNLTAGITFSNLTVGQEYLVQFWVADFRTFPLADRNETITGGANTSGPLAYLDNGDNSASDASYVIGTFIADNTMSQLFTLNANQDTLINAVQLRAVPEPTSALLSALGAVALLRRRRA